MWSVPTALQTVVASSDLQNLATNTSVTTAAYDNSSAKDELADFVFALKYQTSAPSAGDHVADVYLIPSVDGTNYPSTGGSPAVPQAGLHIGGLESRAGSTSALEYLVLEGIQIPPLKFKIVFVNLTANSLANDSSMFGKMQAYNP